jgi:hypothetical protein
MEQPATVASMVPVNIHCTVPLIVLRIRFPQEA